MKTIYFKESEAIEDLLTTMGAMNSSLEIMGVKVIKDIRNRVNRKTNCETANLTKTINAACKQIEEIEFIEKTMGKDYLPEDLAKLAELRKENPDVLVRLPLKHMKIHGKAIHSEWYPYLFIGHHFHLAKLAIELQTEALSVRTD